jgi:hypothetical protein
MNAFRLYSSSGESASCKRCGKVLSKASFGGRISHVASTALTDRWCRSAFAPCNLAISWSVAVDTDVSEAILKLAKQPEAAESANGGRAELCLDGSLSSPRALAFAILMLHRFVQVMLRCQKIGGNVRGQCRDGCLTQRTHQRARSSA